MHDWFFERLQGGQLVYEESWCRGAADTRKRSATEHLVAELDSAGNARKKYTWGLDVSGSAQGADGVAARYDYDAFGDTYRTDGSQAAADNPFRYSTKHTDDENDLVYYGLRFYKQETGRFLNRDLIQEAGGLNLLRLRGQWAGERH